MIAMDRPKIWMILFLGLFAMFLLSAATGYHKNSGIRKTYRRFKRPRGKYDGPMNIYYPNGCDPSDTVNCLKCCWENDQCYDEPEDLYDCTDFKSDNLWSQWTDCIHTTDACHYHRERFQCECQCCQNSWWNTCDWCTSHKTNTQINDCGPRCDSDNTEEETVSQCICKDEHYGDCCTEDCPTVEYCRHYICDNGPPSSCLECHNTTSTNKAYHLSDGQCFARCNWLGHWCWPGKCAAESYLAETCDCIDGFERETPNEHTTKCKLTHKPDIHGCRMGTESSLGEVANTTHGDTLSCHDTYDAFINFKPDHIFFNYDFMLHLPQYIPEQEEGVNDYVTNSLFGVTASEVTVRYYKTNGDISNVKTHDLRNHPDCSHSFNEDNPSPHMVSCMLNFKYSGQFDNMKDGEKLCQRFRVTASGYLYIQDMMHLDNDPVRHNYGDTDYTEERCFIADYTSPDHCLNTDSSCAHDAINFGRRIRRDPDLTIDFEGWFDPDPENGDAGPSGMKEYQLEVRNVIWTASELYADWQVIDNYTTVGEDAISLTLLDNGQPHMFALYVWALDNAQESSNYRLARRFVLVDNYSSVQISMKNPIVPKTASPETNYEWQIALVPVQLDWTEHFFNNWHAHQNLLLPIREETNTSHPITGVFDQEEGELPVDGTDNVDGITNFMYSYARISRASSEVLPFTDVSDPLSQRVVLHETTIQDGDALFITIRAIDVMNNTLEDTVTLYIDSSLPVIEEMYLIKDGYKSLNVPDSTMLSDFNMTFVAYDTHSGMEQVRWKLGQEPGLSDLGQGSLPVLQLFENQTCTEDLSCYCPDIGLCEMYIYNISLDGLIPSGKGGIYSREYYFTFEVMNKAHLTTNEQVKIVVDDSTP